MTMSDANLDESCQCELCGDEVESYVLTSDSHSEGPNILVGLFCCAEGT